MTRLDAARLIAINTVVSLALAAGVAAWMQRTQKPTFGTLDVAELYRLKEAQVAAWIMQKGRENGLEALQDATGNVLIRKHASRGMENRPCIILQSHLDMVCEKNSSTFPRSNNNALIAMVTAFLEGPMSDRIQTFAEFWPFYVLEHADTRNRLLHFVGTSLAFEISTQSSASSSRQRCG